MNIRDRLWKLAGKPYRPQTPENERHTTMFNLFNLHDDCTRRIEDQQRTIAAQYDSYEKFLDAMWTFADNHPMSVKTRTALRDLVQRYTPAGS